MKTPAIELTDVTKIYRRYGGKQFATLKSALLQRSLAKEMRPQETFQALSHVSFSVPKGSTFAVVGRGYKPGVHYEIEAPGALLAARLTVPPYLLRPVPLESAELVIIALPETETRLTTLARNTRVVDVWRTHSYLENYPVEYVPLGGTLRLRAAQR